MLKNSVASAGDVGSVVGLEDLLEKEMATHSVFLPGMFHGQRGLLGYNPSGCKRATKQQQTFH